MTLVYGDIYKFKKDEYLARILMFVKLLMFDLLAIIPPILLFLHQRLALFADQTLTLTLF